MPFKHIRQTNKPFNYIASILFKKLYIHDSPDIQRCSKREKQTAEKDRYRRPFEVVVLAVFQIQESKPHKEQYYEDNVNYREYDVVGYRLYLPLCLIPCAFYRSCYIALGVSGHYGIVHKCHKSRKFTGECSLYSFLQ